MDFYDLATNRNPEKMALKTFVKINSVNNLSDARYCAGMYVHLMGFSLETYDKDYLSPEKFKELTDWLSGVEYVAEFQTAHPGNILETIRDYPGISYLQIQEKAHVQMLVNTSYAIILAQEIRNIDDILQLMAVVPSIKDYDVTLLLNGDFLDLPTEFIPHIRALAEEATVLLGFGIHANTVEEILEQTSVKGIALSGGNEIKPGLKDFDELADILEALEEEEE